MTAVLDASAAIRTVLHQAGSEGVAKVLAVADAVLAPDLMVAEAANALWKYLRAGDLSRSEAGRALQTCLGLVDDFTPLGPLSTEALDLSATLQRPVYDMFYLVLARRRGAILLTTDDSLRQTAQDLGILCGEPAESLRD